MGARKPRSAVLLIEFQKQWTERGLYNWLIRRQLSERKVLKNTRNLVRNARKKRIKVIHAPLIIDPARKKGWLAFVTFGRAFTLGTWKSEITRGLVGRKDLIVKGRYNFDAFAGSDLESILRKNRIERIFICGFTTDQCVARTMKTMLGKGFDAYLVSDCTATLNGFLQKRAERKFPGRIVLSRDI